MALRNQPYIPLYVQDFMTDEKLAECSASSTGVYIRIMCLMHKSDEYGTILLKQKDKQNKNQTINFAHKLLKHLPYSYEIILESLEELINEGVLQINEDKLLQKRMIKDNQLSIIRSEIGSKGGKKTQLAKAKVQPNPEYEIEDETEIENKDIIDDTPEKLKKIREYFFNNSYPLEEADAYYEHYEAQGWVTGSGLPITNWRLKAESWHKEQLNRNYHNKNNGNGQLKNNISHSELLALINDKPKEEKLRIQDLYEAAGKGTFRLKNGK